MRRSPGRPVLPALLALALAVIVPVLVSTSVIGAREADASSIPPAQNSAGHTGSSRSSTGRTPAVRVGNDLGAAERVAAQAPVVSTSPNVDPQYPYAGYLRSSITGITPTVVTATSGDVLTVTGTVTNISKGTLYDLRYVWQRGTPLAGLQAIKAEIATPSRPTAVVGQDWTILGPRTGPTQQRDLAAGATLPFVISVGISDTAGLDVLQRGVFPLMIKVSGDVGQNGQTQYERVGEIHLLATVLSVPKATMTTSSTPAETSSGATPSGATPSGATSPGATPSGATPSGATSAAAGESATTSTTDIPTQGFPTTTATSTSAPSAAESGSESTGSVAAQPDSTAGTPASSTAAPSSTPVPVATNPPRPAVTPSRPVALNMLWPLVDSPHVGVGGIFLDDDLAKEIARGGRLDNILTALARLNTGASSTTVVVDPELLAEVQQMAGGYRVVSTPGRPQAALTPTSVTPSSTAAPSSGSSPSGTSTATTPATGTPSVTTASTPSRPPARPTTRRRDLPTAPAAAATGPRATPKPGAASTAVAAPPTRAAPSSRPVRPTVTPSTPRLPTRPATTRAGPTTPPPNSQPSTTAPSTTASPTGVTTPAPPPANTVAGTGQAAAVAFLARMHTELADRQILVLPYSDPDSVAMIRAGLGAELADLISNGRVVAAQVLQSQSNRSELITDVSVPEDGMVDDATLAFLAAHGMQKALLSPNTLQHSGSAVGAVAVAEQSNKGGVVRAAVTDADLLAAVGELVAKGSSVGLAVREANLAALLTGGSLDGTGTPLIIAPDNRWTPNLAGLTILSTLLRTLATGGVLAGTPIAGIAATARTPATVHYPAQAQQAELDPGYLAKVVQDRQWLGAVSGSLSRAKGDQTPIPADIIDPLSQALVSTGSAALRSDRRFGHSVLRTTESTLGKLQLGVFIAGGTSYTLAASTAPLLITVTNDLPYVVSVRVVIVGGEAVGLTPTDPGVLSIPAGRSQPFKIDTKVVKAGKFPVQAQLEAADGSTWSEATTITVNSSAYGVLTIVLIVVAGGALFLMVVIRIVQRIRGRNNRDDVGPGESGVGAAPTGRPTGPRPDSVLGAANEPSRWTAAGSVALVTSNQPGARASDEDAVGPTAGDAVLPEQSGPEGTGTPDSGESER